MRTKLLLILLILALVPSTMALTATYTAINNSIFKDESASFAITVVNARGYEDSFQVSTRDPSWILTTDPLLTTVPALSTKSHVLYVKPKQSVEIGPHAVPIKLKSIRSGQFKEENLLINIRPKTPFGGEYSPAVRLMIDIGSKVDVREKVPVTVEMTNKNPRDMPDLVLSVDGEIFKKEANIHIGPLEEEVRNFIFDAVPHTREGVYTLTVKLILQNVTIAEATKEFEVIPYSNIEEIVTKDMSFFKSDRVYTLSNNGNLEEDAVKRIQLPFYKKIFVSFDPAPKKVRFNGEDYSEWRKRLAPGEVYDIHGIHNYRILALVIFAIIIALVAYYLFRSPVVVTKEAFAVKAGHDRTIVKVRLEVRNRSTMHMRNISVMDKVPNIADVEKRMDIGTLKPSKVVSSASKGTSMRWQLDVLEPYEERIISYRVKCKLKIVGGMNLPPAKLRFETDKGKERVSYSNTASVADR